MRLRKRIAVAASAAVLGTVAGFGLAQAGGDDPPPLWRPSVTEAAVPATEAQKTAFSVLDKPAGTVVADADRTLLADFAGKAEIGMDVTGARVIGATAGGPIWLVPVNGGLCIALEQTATTAIGQACEPSTDVIGRGTTVGDGTSIYGIVPDAATHVTATPAGGGSTTAVTVGTGGVYTLPSQDATVAVDAPGGLTSFDVAG